MLKYLILITITFTFSCVPAYKSVIAENEKLYYQKLISPDFEKLDTGIFYRMHNRRGKDKHTFMNNGEYRITYNDTDLYKSQNAEVVTIYSTNHKVIKEIERFEGSFILWEYLNQYIYIGKTYYSNGNIKNKGIHSIYNFFIGNQYEFNEMADLISVINTDKGFNFSFSDVLEYCKTNNIVLENVNGERGWVKKGLKKTIWLIETPGESHTYKTFTINAKTGKLIKIGQEAMAID